MLIWDTVVWLLRFLDLVEEAPTGAKLSVTKLSLWCTTILNTITLMSQTDWRIMAGTSIAHIAAVTGRAVKRSIEAKVS